jgi:ribose transport system permease protein
MTETSQTSNFASIDSAIGRKQDTWLSLLLGSQAFWVVIAIILACIYLSFASDAFLTPKNLYNITRNATFVAIIALGMTMVIITGGIDLSVGSVLVLTSMVCAVTMHSGYPIEVGILAALCTAILVGLFNGVLIAYFGFPPFVVTLAMMSIARSLAMVTSQNQTVFEFGPDHDLLLFVGGGSLSFFGLFSVAMPVIYVLILALITGFILRFTRFGRYVFAIGGNEKAAELTGVPVKPIKVAVYVCSALAAGICGVVETGWLGAVTTNLGTGMELQVIAATVIGGANLAGGAGTAIGALVGASLLEIIRNSLGLLGVNAFWQGTFVGGFILVAVTFERIKSARGQD